MAGVHPDVAAAGDEFLVLDLPCLEEVEEGRRLRVEEVLPADAEPEQLELSVGGGGVGGERREVQVDDLGGEVRAVGSNPGELVENEKRSYIHIIHIN